jgi:hypothetical protein
MALGSTAPNSPFRSNQTYPIRVTARLPFLRSIPLRPPYPIAQPHKEKGIR